MNRPARAPLDDAPAPEAPASGSVLPRSSASPAPATSLDTSGSPARSTSGEPPSPVPSTSPVVSPLPALSPCPAPCASSPSSAPSPGPAPVASPVEPSPALLAHLQSKRVFQRLRVFVLGKSIPARHAEDVVQQTLLEAWRVRHTWGPTATDLDKLLYAIARCNVIDHHKGWFRSRLATRDSATPERDPKREAETEYTGRHENGDDFDVPPVDVPSSMLPSLVTPADPHDARYRLGDVSGFVEKNPGLQRAAAWMFRSLAGESFREIAKEEGTSENAVYTAVSRLRAVLRKAAHDGLIVLMVALLLGILFKHMRHRPKDDLGIPSPKPAPTAVAPSPQPTAPPQAQADELRQRAQEACDAKRWDACLGDLDAASQLDPKGDELPAVKELRQTAKEGIVNDQGKP
jgi:DNA-directed RNA polymerase specialized sigma24 family protein